MWFRRRHLQARDELAFHRERLIDDYVAAGMTPESAARRAFLEFGNLASIEETSRDVRGRWFDRPRRLRDRHVRAFTRRGRRGVVACAACGAGGSSGGVETRVSLGRELCDPGPGVCAASSVTPHAARSIADVRWDECPRWTPRESSWSSRRWPSSAADRHAQPRSSPRHHPQAAVGSSIRPAGRWVFRFIGIALTTSASDTG